MGAINGILMGVYAVMFVLYHCMSPCSIYLIAVFPCPPKFWKGSHGIVHQAKIIDCFDLLED